MSLIRQPAVAGMFYPQEEKILSQMVGQFLKDSPVPLKDEGTLKVLIAPHAGYIYSGPVAGACYKQLDTLDKNKHWKVFLLGPAHRVSLQGISICAYDHFQTPMGRVQVSPIAKTLAAQFGFLPEADQQEHSLEVQLPFLQAQLSSFELIPIVIGAAPPKGLANILAPLLDEDSLLVISTDLSHFLPYEEARLVDAIANQAIPDLDIDLMMEKGDACGLIGVLTAMELAKEQQWSGHFLDYQNSGDTAGDKDRVVGYGAYCFLG